MLIGKKENFAIEFEINGDFINFKLFLNNIQIGCDDDESYLGTHLHIQKLLDADVCTNLELTNFNILYYTENFFDESVFPLSQWLDLGEGFDDFYIKFIKKELSYIFVWKLDDEACFDYKNYSYEVQAYEVHRDIVEKTITSFIEEARRNIQ